MCGHTNVFFGVVYVRYFINQIRFLFLDTLFFNDVNKINLIDIVLYDIRLFYISMKNIKFFPTNHVEGRTIMLNFLFLFVMIYIVIKFVYSLFLIRLMSFK